MDVVLDGKYRLESSLGQGAMGKVYLGKHTRNGQYFAIKECISQNPKVIERIRREFYFMTRLNHPNIVRAFDFLQLHGRYFIVMDYIRGTTIREFLQKKPVVLSFDQQLQIAIQICDAVATLNKADIIHRDIKPSNIILENNHFTPKLLDLGIAKMTGGGLETLTQPGKVIGTPQYMSPEQIEHTATNNSDVFSLGVVLYQWFCWMENSPFYGRSVRMSFRNVLQMELPTLQEFLQEDTPHVIYLSQILQNALQKDPNKRISSTGELLKMLAKCPKAQDNDTHLLLPSKPSTNEIYTTFQVEGQIEDATQPYQQPHYFKQASHSSLNKQNNRDVYQESSTEIYEQPSHFQSIPTLPKKNKEKIFDVKVILIPVLGAAAVGVFLFYVLILSRKEPTRKTAQNKVVSQKAQRIPQKKKKTKKIEHKQPQDNKIAIVKNPSNKNLPQNPPNELIERKREVQKKLLKAYYKLAHNYFRLQQYKKAITYFSKTIEANPSHVNAYKYRGLSHYFQSDYRRAISDLQIAIRLAPELEDEVGLYIEKAEELGKE